MLGTGSLNVIPPVVPPVVQPVVDAGMMDTAMMQADVANLGLAQQDIGKVTFGQNGAQLPGIKPATPSMVNQSQVNTPAGGLGGGENSVFSMDNLAKYGKLATDLGGLVATAYFGDRQLDNTETQINNNNQKYRAKMATDRSRKGSMVGDSNAGSSGHKTKIAADDYELKDL